MRFERFKFGGFASPTDGTDCRGTRLFREHHDPAPRSPGVEFLAKIVREFRWRAGQQKKIDRTRYAIKFDETDMIFEMNFELRIALFAGKSHDLGK